MYLVWDGSGQFFGKCQYFWPLASHLFILFWPIFHQFFCSYVIFEFYFIFIRESQRHSRIQTVSAGTWPRLEEGKAYPPSPPNSGWIKFRLLHKIRPKSSWTTQNLLAKILDCALVRPSHSSKMAQLIVLVWSKGQSFWVKGLVGLDLRGHLGALPYLSSLFCLVFSTHIFIASDNAEL